MEIITLLDTLVKTLFKAEEEYLNDLKDFNTFEKAVKSSTDEFAANFLSGVLSSIDEQIRNSKWRKEYYTIQRRDTRTKISSVGDLIFNNTCYKRVSDGKYVYLLAELINLAKNERFTEQAEVMLLTEALKTSYQEATKVLPSKQKITKTTVMNKVHQIAEDFPYERAEKPREADYLFIEADEDHIAEQHGDLKEEKANKSFISKLIYIYEAKRNVAGYKARKELVNKFYFSGVYPGRKENEKLWEQVQDYINKTYNTDTIKRIFVSGDAAGWIKSGVDYLDKALFCADKYHLMQYINQAAAQIPDEKDNIKDELWHILYSKRYKTKERFDEYTLNLMLAAKNPDKVNTLRTYVLGNWAAIRRTLRNKLVDGCSAESHVSHVLSDRLSSRPMGWSQVGADKMSKLRCFERNYGRENLIKLVRYSREQRALKATGTDDIPVQNISVREILAEHRDQAKSYIERIQAHIPGFTARKTAAIRAHLRLL